MNKLTKKFLGIFFRYIIIILIALPNLYLFYLVFTPLTIYPVYWITKLFTDVSLNGNILSMGKYTIELIGACIAGSAYYLLVILNLSTPNIKFKKRICMIFSSFLIFLFFNLLRILILILLFSNDFNFFDITHKIFWYALSTILVLAIWFFEIKMFKIKEIPIYTDLKYLYRQRKNA
jgi:exosortase/archaeosortase family protein